MQKQDKKLTSSVIICTKDREKDLLECVDSIIAQTILPEELIIVDAGKENEINTKLEEKLKKTPLQLKYIQTQPGLTRQRNIGVKNSSRDIIFFFDDDVVLDKDYIKNILEIYNSNTETNVNLGGVSGKMLNFNKPPNLLIKIFRKIFFLSPNGMLPPGFFDHTLSPHKRSKVRIFSGCNMSYRREVLENFKFDENLKGYSFMEDVDLSFRVSQRYTLIQSSDATLVHKFAPTSHDRLRKRVEMEVVNTSYLFKKNMPKSFKNYVLFTWSRLGVFLWMLFMCLRKRNSGWVAGFIQGLKVKKSYAKN